MSATNVNDGFRKPGVMMWKHFTAQLNNGVEVDFKESFYCGDAAGRPATKNREKDFSDSDLKFAKNTGLKFYTPESLFLDQPMTGVQKSLSFASLKKQEEPKIKQDEPKKI